MKFFHFHQNNSGGSFHVDDERGIGVNVIIEAANYEDANNRAEAIGIYFDGCSDGRDCPCCGDRWSAQCTYEDGDDEPAVYGEPVEEFLREEPRRIFSSFYSDDEKKIFIHYANQQQTINRLLPNAS